MLRLGTLIQESIDRGGRPRQLSLGRRNDDSLMSRRIAWRSWRNVRSKKENSESAGKPPCRLSSCAFSSSEVVAFDRRWSEARYSKPNIEIHMEAALVPVGPPQEGVRSRLEAFLPERAPPPPAPSPWVKEAALQRMHFGSSALRAR